MGMTTKKKMAAEIEIAEQAWRAAEEAVDAAIAAHGTDSPEEEAATEISMRLFREMDTLQKKMGKAFPAPLGRQGDRGCGKSRR